MVKRKRTLEAAVGASQRPLAPPATELPKKKKKKKRTQAKQPLALEEPATSDALNAGASETATSDAVTAGASETASSDALAAGAGESRLRGRVPPHDPAALEKELARRSAFRELRQARVRVRVRVGAMVRVRVKVRARRR